MGIIVNNHYPLDYFGIISPDQVAPLAGGFWASEEELAPAAEYLELTLGGFRPINFIDFQICQKPINFKILYNDENNEWQDIEVNPQFPVSLAVAYIDSNTAPWTYFECRFALTITNKLRIEFTRREEAFPTATTDPFPWSIEVRALRVMHVIQSYEDFVPDTGTDILGNSFITDIDAAVADNVIDEDSTTYWQSQANPRPDAVEALFFDLRGGYERGTMGSLDNFYMGRLDERGMLSLGEYYPDATVIDEIFIDPITTGPIMHLYYSNDDEPDPNSKLWTPIARHYVLRRGFFAFPRPVFCKFIKMEFTRLAAAPYNITQYPDQLEITYNRFPAWVQDYFTSLLDNDPDTFINPIQTVNLNLLDMSYQNNTELDMFDTQIELIRNPVLLQNAEDPRTFISTISIDEDRDSSILFDQIQFNSPFMWQRDLISEMDDTRALTRFTFSGQSSWQAEGAMPESPSVSVQSVPDLTESKKEKQLPIMYFPRKCRHEYQVVQVPRNQNICYFVGIKEVSFYRRDYREIYDQPYYIETFEDEVHIDKNEFDLDDWRMVVTP